MVYKLIINLLEIMEELLNAGFKLVETVRGTPNGYPNDVLVYHRVIREGIAYQEVRVDFDDNKLAFENIFGNTNVFKIWLGIKQALSTDNLKNNYY